MLLVGGLCALRVWLGLALSLRPIGTFSLDDLLFARMTVSLIHGDWLGAYDEEILTVGPFYPIWAALSFRAGVPLILSQQLLYVFACVLIFFVLNRFVRRQSVRLLIFALLLFAPSSFDFEATRFLRDNLYMSLTMLVVATFLGLLGAGLRPARVRLAWAGAAGVALSAFWLTREEGPWIAPTLAVILCYSLWKSWPVSRSDRATQLAIHTLPIVLCAGAVFSAALTNYVRYNVFHVVELRDPAFLAAHGALLRVRHLEPNLYAQAPRETRRRIYAVSPTFALLEPYLESSSYGGQWGAVAEVNLKLGKPNPEDIRGAWFMWGLRRGVSVSGYHRTAAEARNFYRRVADEINAACDAGRLDCGPERASLQLPFKAEYLPWMAQFAGRAAWHLCTLDTLRYPVERLNPYETMKEHDWEVFREAARGRLLRDDARLAAATGRTPYAVRLQALRTLHDVYPVLLVPLFVIGGAAFVAGAFAEGRRRGVSEKTLICAALLLGVAARITILSYLSITAFDALEPRYLAPMYPLCILAFGLALGRAANDTRIS